MFQFSGLAPFRVIHLQCTRLSHSEIFGLSLVCSYPKLIAAYHVLHRLLVPRHPPYALIRFKYCIIYFLSRVTDSVHYFLPYYLPCTLCSETGKNCFPNMSKNFKQCANVPIRKCANCPCCCDIRGLEPHASLYWYTSVIITVTQSGNFHIPSFSHFLILSHIPSFSHFLIWKKVEDIGVEPMTPCVQGRCSGQLS